MDRKTLIEGVPVMLLALCVWREARGESLSAKAGVAWTVKNRVQRPGWWGAGWVTVILAPEQYSSMNPGRAKLSQAEVGNAMRFPRCPDPSWDDSLDIAAAVMGDELPDPTGGATHYFDASLDSNPPSWARSGEMQKVSEIGRLRFWRSVHAEGA